MIEREAMYFEPRCVSECGSVRWYGEIIQDDRLLRHVERTVYIRDSGDFVNIYRMEQDEKCAEDAAEIRTTLRRICRVKKLRKDFRYGRRTNRR